MSYSHPIYGSTEHAKKLRKEAGIWLKGLREAAGLTQMELARAVGYDYYTFVSAIEIGKSRIPPEKYALFAQAYQTDPAEFMARLLRYYDPYAYALLKAA